MKTNLMCVKERLESNTVTEKTLEEQKLEQMSHKETLLVTGKKRK